MLATCEYRLEWIRDRAMLCFGFANGGRRSSEFAAATCATCAGLGAGAILFGVDEEYCEIEEEIVLRFKCMELEVATLADVISPRFLVRVQAGAQRRKASISATKAKDFCLCAFHSTPNGPMTPYANLSA